MLYGSDDDSKKRDAFFGWLTLHSSSRQVSDTAETMAYLEKYCTDKRLISKSLYEITDKVTVNRLRARLEGDKLFKFFNRNKTTKMLSALKQYTQYLDQPVTAVDDEVKNAPAVSETTTADSTVAFEEKQVEANANSDVEDDNAGIEIVEKPCVDKKSVSTPAQVEVEDKAENDYHDESIIAYLKERDIPFVDKRPQGGNLWIIDADMSLTWVLTEYKKRENVYFRFVRGGSKSTNGLNAWYMVEAGKQTYPDAQNGINVVSIAPKPVMQPVKTSYSDSVKSVPANTVKRVDFDHPELCSKTKPISCIVQGEIIVFENQTWAKLLTAITEHFIKSGNSRVKSLRNTALYGRREFFLDQKLEYLNCVKLSNGKWLCVNYDPKTIVTIIKRLGMHCKVDLNDISITYEANDGKAPRTIKEREETDATQILDVKPTLDRAMIRKLTRVLINHYSNGYRLDSIIEITRLRAFYEGDLSEILALSDDVIKTYVTACGTLFEGKVYVVIPSAKERVRETVDNYFAQGGKVIFFDEFYSKNEKWLFKGNIVSCGMLKGILRDLYSKLWFSKTFFGFYNSNISVVVDKEILRVWNGGILLSYDHLAKRLEYVPIERIKQALAANADYIWNSTEVFTHVSMVKISRDEKTAIRQATERECNTHGYVCVSDLPITEIAERNYALSPTAIYTAVHSICLADKFDKKGKIIMRKGEALDIKTLVKDYCKSVDRCTLDDIRDFEKELTGDASHKVFLASGMSVLVRIDKDTFVADKYVHFDCNGIDDVISSIIKCDYLPLQSFTTFGAFPDCGQVWNLYLLESYCRRFSEAFTFAVLAYNSVNAGVVVRRNSPLIFGHKDMSFVYANKIIPDAVAMSQIDLTEKSINEFLYDEGYIGQHSYSKTAELISIVKALREGRN